MDILDVAIRSQMAFPSYRMEKQTKKLLCVFYNTVDGRNPFRIRTPGMTILLQKPTNNGFPWFLNGAGFRPSTVCLNLEMETFAMVRSFYPQVSSP